MDSLGHAWQSIVIRDATCETDGKLLELCSRCGQMKQTATPKGEHQYKTHPVAATCTNPGYTVRECSVCGDRHIEDITSVLPHNYESHVIAATCEGGGKTIHRCDGCGSSFVTDYDLYFFSESSVLPDFPDPLLLRRPDPSRSLALPCAFHLG